MQHSERYTIGIISYMIHTLRNIALQIVNRPEMIPINTKSNCLD
jgi:hypothetical protein